MANYHKNFTYYKENLTIYLENLLLTFIKVGILI
jgi:hypothetical protein